MKRSLSQHLKTDIGGEALAMIKTDSTIKIGLYLQTQELHGKRLRFNSDMKVVRKSNIDILVFPEFAWFPFIREFRNASLEKEADRQSIFALVSELSRNIGRAVVISNEDSNGLIVSMYANAQAEGDDTQTAFYIKHTMTSRSAFDLDDYPDLAEKMFSPIIFRDKTIGMTICYDCNHAAFSRMYGIQNVDIILNSTGGDVVYDKWHRYNKARAIENNCYTFVTMGGDGCSDKFHSYVFGISPSGRDMEPVLLRGTDNDTHNIPGGIYVFKVPDKTTDGSKTFAAQLETVNKAKDFTVSPDEIEDIFRKSKRLEDYLYLFPFKGKNLVFCVVDGERIMKPEIVLKLLYSDKLESVDEKHYIIVNRWETLDRNFYEEKLSTVLKVRAMENYCAVLLLSNNIWKCFQTGRNRTAQIVKLESDGWGIDLARTGGAETIWKNKTGMRRDWRKGYEWLIAALQKKEERS